MPSPEAIQRGYSRHWTSDGDVDALDACSDYGDVTTLPASPGAAADLTPEQFQRRVRRDCPGLIVSAVTGTVSFAAGIGEADQPPSVTWAAVCIPVNSAYRTLRAGTLAELAGAVAGYWRGVNEKGVR